MKKVGLNSWWLGLCFLSLVSVFFMFSCERNQTKNTDHPQGSFSISGAFALYPLTVKWVEEFRKDYPDIRVDVSAGGAGKGMVDVLADMVDLGMFSREVTPEEKQNGAWYIAVAKDAVVATINEANPFCEMLYEQGVTKAQLQALFTQDKTWYWADIHSGISANTSIHIYTRSDACGAAQVWASFLGTNQESLQGVGVFGDPGMADAVKKDGMSLGYNNVAYAYHVRTRQKYDGIEILPIDFNGNGRLDPEENVYQSLDSLMSAILEGLYPAPPARELYFIAKGKPDNELVLLFLNWVLTKGQQFVNQSGYVNLSEKELKVQQLLIVGDAQ